MPWPIEISDYFYTHPEKARKRVTRKELQAMLLYDEPLVAKGYIWDWKFKHIAAGIYDLWAERHNGTNPSRPPE